MISVYIRHKRGWELAGKADSWNAARMMMREWAYLGYTVVAKGNGIQTPILPPE